MSTKKQTTKTKAQKTQNVETTETIVKITTSAELSENVGFTVETPTGKKFKVLSWLKPSERKKQMFEDTATAYGSFMSIEHEGRERFFLSNCGEKKFKGYEKLSDFYEEVGLQTSGKSGAKKEHKKTTFAETFETLKSVITDATDDEIVNLLIFVQKVLKYLNLGMTRTRTVPI